MAQILTRVPQDVKDDLLAEAKRRGQTLNGLIRQILWEWLKKNKDTA